MTSLFFQAVARVDEGPLRWASLPPPWMLTLVVIVGFFWIRSLYRNERGGAGRWQRLGLSVLRTIILLLIVLILGGPFRQEERKVVERSHLVVLVDTSASMKVKDKYPADEERKLLDVAFDSGRPGGMDDVARGDLVKRTLGDEGAGLLRKWAERFVLHVFAFDGDWRKLGSTQKRRGKKDEKKADEDLLQPILDALEAAPLDGGRTRLGAVLRSAANEYARRKDQHLAGIVMFSDGRDTSDGEPPQQVLADMGPLRD